MAQWDFCPVCGRSFPSTAKLGVHMKDEHQRLIICSDIAKAREERERLMRQYDPEL